MTTAHETPIGGAQPYITDDGVLIIPRDCDEAYRWWAGGQSIAKTLIELGAPEAVWKLYSHEDYPDELKDTPQPDAG